MHYCCCFNDIKDRTRSQTFSLAPRRTSNSPHHFNDDVLNDERPSVVSSKLEIAIEQWERAIDMYKESEQSLVLQAQSNLENTIINDNLDEALSSISSIRQEPYKYIKNKNDIIVDLAVKRSEIFRWMKVLGLDKLEDSEIEMTAANSDNDDNDTSSVDNPIHNDNQIILIPADPLLDPKESDIKNTPKKGNIQSNIDDKIDNNNNIANGLLLSSSSSVASNLALKWANHLKNVDPTQGTLKALTPLTDKKKSKTPTKTNNNYTTNSGIITPISTNKIIRPKWPDFLVDVSYDILKISKLGMKSRITLKLTEYHLVYIKDGEEVTKIVSYKQIFEVSLKGGNIFTISMYGKKEITFSSPLASHIIQQIVTRVKVRLSLDKTSLLNEFMSPLGLNYSIAATETLINKISDDNATGASDTMLSFANLLGESYITRISEAKSAKSFIHRVSETSIRRFSLSTKPKRLQTEYNLLTYKEGTGEYNLRTYIQKAIFDTDTDEGNTLKDFTQTFKDNNRSFSDVRHFIDGLYTFVMEKRGNQLASSLTFESEDDLSELSKAEISTISFIVFITIEEAVYVPLKDTLIAMLLEDNKKNIESSPKENLIIRNMKLLSKRSQESSNIPKELISPLGWQSAIYELSSLENNLTPSLQLNALTRASKSIYSEYKHAILPNLQAADRNGSHLGADDFLPIFIYVFCKSTLTRPSLHYQLMWKLCHPDQLHGECGYYLTVYESSVDFVSKEIQRKSLLNNLFTFT